MLLGKWVRENPALAVGISLPVVVVAFFLAAKQLPLWFVEPPQFDFVFSDQIYSADMTRWSVAIDVDERSRLRIQAIPEFTSTNRVRERLFRYEHETATVREIRIPLPPELPPVSPPRDNKMAPVTVDVPELRHVLLDPDHTAPDGYVFVGAEYPGYSVFSDLFLSRRRPRGPKIRKGAAVIPIEAPSPQGYTTRFYGWVLPPKERETP